jgi:hypothetical protein
MVVFGLAVVPYIPASKLVQVTQEPSLRFKWGKYVVHQRRNDVKNNAGHQQLQPSVGALVWQEKAVLRWGIPPDALSVLIWAMIS